MDTAKRTGRTIAVLLLAQIETRKAVDNVDARAAPDQYDSAHANPDALSFPDTHPNADLHAFADTVSDPDAHTYCHYLPDADAYPVGDAVPAAAHHAHALTAAEIATARGRLPAAPS